MDLIFAYLAGLLTLINPCVLPVLPIVLASALQAGRFGPLLLVAGMSVSFVGFGLFVTTVGYGLGLTAETLAHAGAVLMIGFGLVLMVPQLSTGFASVTAGFAARADASITGLDGTSGAGQFLGGALLGAVWSPCVGPTLGGAIVLASQGHSLIWAGSILTAFALGVSTVMLALGYGARSVIVGRQQALRRLATISRPLLGAVFAAIGLAIFFDAQHLAEGWVLGRLPDWLVDLSVRY